MKLHQLILVNNACYKAGTAMTPKGIMIRSTGANNPYLKRYVGPNDGLLGENQYNNHWNQPNPDGMQKCYHGFIGKLADGTVATYQTLPWTMRGWHCKSGPNGSGNDTHISFSICEDDLTHEDYFRAVYKEAVELCAYLCGKYGLRETDIIDHSEGYKLGIANSLACVSHWFPKFGKTMDSFRADVKKLLGPGKPDHGGHDGHGGHDDGCACCDDGHDGHGGHGDHGDHGDHGGHGGNDKPCKPDEPKTLYIVQLEATYKKQHAEALLSKALACGFDNAFIRSEDVR